jgi:hypothetical protein
MTVATMMDPMMIPMATLGDKTEMALLEVMDSATKKTTMMRRRTRTSMAMSRMMRTKSSMMMRMVMRTMGMPMSTRMKTMLMPVVLMILPVLVLKIPFLTNLQLLIKPIQHVDFQ